MNKDNSHILAAQRFIESWRTGTAWFEAHTSGSTGTPKRIMLPRKLMEESAMRSIRHFALNSNSTVHLMLSPDYIAGKMCIVRALVSGARLTMEAPSSAPLRSYNTPYAITLLSAVGAQVESMYALKQVGRLPQIQHLLLGGSPLTDTMRRKAVGLATHVWESYGMTETASHIALRRVSIPPEPFTPLAGIHTSVDDRGCLVIDMPTAGHIITNDLADRLADGRFSILGRADNVIMSGGLKVIPEQVESILAPYLSPTPFYISSRPHPKWGEQVIIIIETVGCDVPPQAKAPASIATSDGTSLQEVSRRLLRPHERPAAIYAVPSLQYTSSGKIIRNKLKISDMVE